MQVLAEPVVADHVEERHHLHLPLRAREVPAISAGYVELVPASGEEELVQNAEAHGGVVALQVGAVLAEDVGRPADVAAPGHVLRVLEEPKLRQRH